MPPRGVKQMGIDGRSKMTWRQLVSAINGKKS